MRFLKLALGLIAFSLNLYGQSQHSSIKVQGHIYQLSLDSSGFRISSGLKSTLYNPDYYFLFKVQDFDQDGYKDILLERGGSNTPAMFDLLKYHVISHDFKWIKNFIAFPAPVPIKKTGYYYSYHKNGCADECWISDLFYIKDFNAIRIGSIDCEVGTSHDAISVYRLLHGKKVLVKNFPLNTIEQYKGYKWGFIKKYWFKNYRGFL